MIRKIRRAKLDFWISQIHCGFGFFTCVLAQFTHTGRVGKSTSEPLGRQQKFTFTSLCSAAISCSLSVRSLLASGQARKNCLNTAEGKAPVLLPSSTHRAGYKKQTFPLPHFIGKWSKH